VTAPASEASVVITTIFAPSEAVKTFVSLGHRLVVIGDRKTPADWECPGVEFLGIEQQRKLPYRIARSLPLDHYSRKMLGYLVAQDAGARVIADSDDDNIPDTRWGFPEFDGEYDLSPPDRGFVNVYRSFVEQFVWPRGFPLERVNDPLAVLDRDEFSCQHTSVGVWQALTDGDPDVDAIYRLTRGEPCYFEARAPLVLELGTLSPFNSQNTAFRRELFPLLYLPGYVRFRFTDILRGLVAQPIMWDAGYRLGFVGSNTTQIRNEHDLLRDFESELDCYLLSTRIVAIVTEAVRSGAGIETNLHNAYEALAAEKIVPPGELKLVESWLLDLSR